MTTVHGPSQLLYEVAVSGVTDHQRVLRRGQRRRTSDVSLWNLHTDNATTTGGLSPQRLIYFAEQGLAASCACVAVEAQSA